MDYKQIGQRIRKERQKLYLTREKFAEVIDLSTNFVGQIERGEKKMSLETLVKISDCLHVSLDYLVKGTEDSAIKSDKDDLQELIYKCSPYELSLVTDVVRVMLPRLKGENDK